MKFRVERICRSDSISAIPLEKVRFDLVRSCDALRTKGYQVESHELYLVTKVGPLDVTIYGSGRVLVHPLNDKTKAKELAQTIFEALVPE
jgi:ArsR family metal-binding transcriptional regulator